jgi:Zn-dependent protease/CBS domain-containing protein
MADAGHRTDEPREEKGALLRASIGLGRIAGIPVGLHYSWFLIAGLITLSLSGHFAATQPGWTPVALWGVAAATAVLFFVTLLAHELSHALMARAYGLPVHSITLFALGGVAQIGRDSHTPRAEFLIAIVGPIASLVIGGACLAAAWTLGWSPAHGMGVMAAVLGWLGSINILLAVFNMIPGYPLDGGRVLRAALWAWSGDQHRATRLAARTGQGVALLFMAGGLLLFMAGAGIGGLWLAFIGWFLMSAAQGAYMQALVTESLRDIRVEDVMAHDCATVDEHSSVQALVDDVLLRTGRRCIVVGHNGHPLGLVTPAEIRGLARERWPVTPVRDVMRPLDAVRSVTPETGATEAFSTMAQEDLQQLPVVRDGRLEGVVGRRDILEVIEARSELRKAS